MFGDLAQWQQLSRLQQEGRYDQMLPVFTTILESNPKLGVAWHGKGIALLEMGRLHEAGDAFSQAMTLGGLGTDHSGLMLAVCWRHIHHPEEALRVLDLVYRQTGLPPELARQIEFAQAQAYLHQGDPQAAWERLQHYLAQGGLHSEMVRLYQAEALARTQRLPQAQELLAQVQGDLAPLASQLQEILTLPVQPGHPGLVDWASKLQGGADPALFAFLNHPNTIHLQRHLGVMMDVTDCGNGTRLLIFQPDSRFAGLRLVTWHPEPQLELMVTCSAESWGPWADLLLELAGQAGPWTEGSLQSIDIPPYHSVLLAPSTTLAADFAQGPSRYLALYPLLPDEAELCGQQGHQEILQRLSQGGWTDAIHPQRDSCLSLSS